MTRTLFWGGWIVFAGLLLAMLLVAHAFLSSPDAVDPIAGSSGGATLASVETAHDSYLVVTSLKTGGNGEVAGLRVGDRIEEVDGLPAPTIAAFNADMVQSSYKDIVLRVRRGRTVMNIALKRPAGGVR